MYCVLVIAVCLLGQISGMTTHRPHHHATESNEFDQAMFYYDAHSHQMVMKRGQNCYIEKLKGSLRPQVHTPEGLMTMENNLMFLVAKGVHTQMNHEDVNGLSIHVEHMCAGQDVFVVSHPHHHHTTTIGVIG